MQSVWSRSLFTHSRHLPLCSISFNSGTIGNFVGSVVLAFSYYGCMLIAEQLENPFEVCIHTTRSGHLTRLRDSATHFTSKHAHLHHLLSMMVSGTCLTSTWKSSTSGSTTRRATSPPLLTDKSRTTSPVNCASDQRLFPSTL